MGSASLGRPSQVSLRANATPVVFRKLRKRAQLTWPLEGRDLAKVV